MNLAIVTFHNDESERQMCGIVTAPICLYHNLSKLPDINVYLISTNFKSKNQSFKDLYHVVDNNFVEILNEFDFVIFISPGRPTEKLNPDKLGNNYDYVLKGLDTPFAIAINEERDRDVYPYYTEFINHPSYSLIMYNSSGMNEDFEDVANGRPFVEFNFIPEIPTHLDVMELAKNNVKSNVIKSTARWTDRKRIKELVEITPDLDNYGYKVQIASTSASYFYTQKVESTNGFELVECTGHYTPSDLDEVMRDVKYHYNFVYLKKKTKGRTMRPRLEIATLEALFRGVLPIACEDTTPDWFHDSGAITLASTELHTLPHFLTMIDDHEYLSRISDCYNAVVDNITSGYEIIKYEISKIVERSDS